MQNIFKLLYCFFNEFFTDILSIAIISHKKTTIKKFESAYFFLLTNLAGYQNIISPTITQQDRCFDKINRKSDHF